MDTHATAPCLRPVRLALVAAVLGLPLLDAAGAAAQGTAPNQGVTAPQSGGSDSQTDVRPSQLTDGRVRQDTGQAAPTRTDGGTTAGIPMPSGANTDPATTGGNAGGLAGGSTGGVARQPGQTPPTVIAPPSAPVAPSRP